MSKKICIFGDSITEGFNDFKYGGWANRFKKWYENKDDENSVYNLGISGDNTEDLLKRFEIEAEAREPGVIIFAIGVNDSAYRESLKGNRINFEQFKNNLEIILQKAKAFTDKIIFIGILAVDEKKVNPKSWNLDFSTKNNDVQKYDRAIKDFCKKNNLLFIEMYDLLDKDDLEDGLHPNAKGHEKIFQKVKDFLIENKII